MNALTISTSIIAPKLTNRFRALFCDSTHQPLSFGHDISAQVISISAIEQSKLSSFNKPVTLKVADDVCNKACSALQELYKLDKFNLKLELLNGDDHVLRTYYLKGCSVSTITHSSLDYGGPQSLESRLSTPSFMSNKLDELRATNEVYAAVETLLRSLTIVTANPHDKREAVLFKLVTVSFSQLVLT